jgi:hypothetical protein
MRSDLSVTEPRLNTTPPIFQRGAYEENDPLTR